MPATIGVPCGSRSSAGGSTQFDHATESDAPEFALYDDRDETGYNPNGIEERDRRMTAALRARFGEDATIVYPSSVRRPLQRSLDFTVTEPLGPA